VGDGANLVVVHRVGGVRSVEDLANFLDASRLVLLELVTQFVALVGVALEAQTVDPVRDFANHVQHFRCEDRSLLDHDRDRNAG